MANLEQKIAILSQKLHLFSQKLDIASTIKKIYEMHNSNGELNIDKFSDDIATLYAIKKNEEETEGTKFNFDCDMFTDNMIQKIKPFIPEDSCAEPIELFTDFIRSFFAIDVEFSQAVESFRADIGYIVNVNMAGKCIVWGVGSTYDEAKVDAAREALKRIKYDKSLLVELIDYEETDDYLP